MSTSVDNSLLPWCLREYCFSRFNAAVMVAILGLVGCDANMVVDQQFEEVPPVELICSDATRRPERRVGDAPIIHGFIIAGSGELGFRPCNSDDIFFLRASVTDWEAIESSAGGEPTYVRFRGVELVCDTDIPAPYVGGVRIQELLTDDTKPPANCR